MRPRLPSPATVISCIALFVALGGTSLAAISFAKNAGAVDNKSATGVRASLNRAAGKLIAAGSDGKIGRKFLDLPAASASGARTFGSNASVTDNAAGAAAAVASDDRVGSLTATCADQAPAAGVEDPTTTLTFTNTSGQVLNYRSRLGVNPASVVAIQPGTTQSITVNGSNTFEIGAAFAGVDAAFEGAVRQDGKQTPDAKCLVYGTLTLVG